MRIPQFVGVTMQYIFKFLAFLNGKKTFIGFAIQTFLQKGFVPDKTVWYKILEYIGDIFIFVGGSHKVVKNKERIKELGKEFGSKLVGRGK